MLDTALPAELVDAYRSTEYWVFSDPPFALRIGEFSKRLADILAAHDARGAAYITAWNPLGEPLQDDDNAARNAVLLEELRRSAATIVDGEGRGVGGDWPAERSYLAIGISFDEACALGRQFGQNAIVWADASATPQLVLLR